MTHNNLLQAYDTFGRPRYGKGNFFNFAITKTRTRPGRGTEARSKRDAGTDHGIWPRDSSFRRVFFLATKKASDGGRRLDGNHPHGGAENFESMWPVVGVLFHRVTAILSTSPDSHGSGRRFRNHLRRCNRCSQTRLRTQVDRHDGKGWRKNAAATVLTDTVDRDRRLALPDPHPESGRAEFGSNEDEAHELVEPATTTERDATLMHDVDELVSSLREAERGRGTRSTA